VAITREGLTLEGFLALPEEKPALEYCAGVVTRKVAPLYEHSVLRGEILLALTQQLRPHNLAEALPELRATYDGRSYVPDVCVYRRERLPRPPRPGRGGEIFVAPDLAVEIRSPGQRLSVLVRKCEWYVDHGVQVALLVDDRNETVRALRPHRPMDVHRRDARVALDEIVPGLHLDVAVVFGALDGE
jgi:Uma2 family endonuclease